MNDLPDINVWLALAYDDHVHHRRAAEYWPNEARAVVSFCRITALGFLRLSTTASFMGGKPSTIEGAWQSYRALTGLPEVGIVPEPAGCGSFFEEISLREMNSVKMWTDAYLAAFAMAGNFRLVSFDAGLRRFSGLNFLFLSP